MLSSVYFTKVNLFTFAFRQAWISCLFNVGVAIENKQWYGNFQMPKFQLCYATGWQGLGSNQVTTGHAPFYLSSLNSSQVDQAADRQIGLSIKASSGFSDQSQAAQFPSIKFGLIHCKSNRTSSGSRWWSDDGLVKHSLAADKCLQPAWFLVHNFVN